MVKFVQCARQSLSYQDAQEMQDSDTSPAGPDPYQYLEAVTLKFLFSRLNSPNFLQRLLRGSISQPSVIFIALPWPLSKILYLV